MIDIDSATLDATEWCCRRFQVLTGRTNVWLAAQLTNLSIIVYFVWVAAYLRLLPFFGRILIGLFCSGVLYVLSQTVFRMSIEAAENNAYRRVAKGLRNPRRVRDAPLRISFLTLSVFFFYPFLIVYFNLYPSLIVNFLRNHVALLSYPLVVLTTVLLYVVGCDPLPPCAGKLGEWLRGSAPSRQAGFDPARARQRVDREVALEQAPPGSFQIRS
jgi:hypothetical protein